MSVHGIPAGLTARQMEIANLLRYDGMSTRRIAEKLFISEATVRNHVQAIMTELGVHSRLELVAHLHQQHDVERQQIPRSTEQPEGQALTTPTSGQPRQAAVSRALPAHQDTALLLAQTAALLAQTATLLLDDSEEDISTNES